MQKIIDITDRKHWWSALRAGASVYVDYTEEGFCARFFLENKVLMCERKGEYSKPYIAPAHSSYLLLDAYNLGTIITKDEFDRFPND